MIHTNQNGQIIVEVLFAVGIVAMCLIALTSISSTAINNGIYAKNAQLANRYAQEGLEVARRLRDRSAGWNSFYTTYTNDRCLAGDNSFSSCNCSVSNPASNIDNFFFRCLTFTNDTAERKKITAKVSWADGSNRHTVEAVTFLTKWSK